MNEDQDVQGVIADAGTGQEILTSNDPQYGAILGMLNAARTRGQGAAMFNRMLEASRHQLTIGDLIEGGEPKARFEQAFPAVRSAEGRTAYFYTVDITLDGNRLTGCMLAHSCALVFAFTRHQADELANEGIRTTIAKGRDYRDMPEESPLATLGTEYGGTKMDLTPMHADTLRTDPRLKEQLINRHEQKGEETRRKKRWQR